MPVLLSNLGIGAVWQAVNSPAGRVTVVLVALGAWTWWNRVDAAHDAREEVRAEVRAEYERQVGEAVQLASEARIRASETDAKIERLQEMKDDILENIGPDACDIPDDVRERLLEIQ